MQIFTRAMKKSFAASGETQSTIARKAGISKTNLSKYMNEKTEPGLGIVSKIANAFGLNVADFLARGREEADEDEQIVEIENKAADWKEKYYEESEAHKNTLLELNELRKELDELRKKP